MADRELSESSGKQSLQIMEEGTKNKLRCCLSTEGVRDVKFQLEMELEKEVKASRRAPLSTLERRDKARTFSETHSNRTGGNGNVS